MKKLLCLLLSLAVLFSFSACVKPAIAPQPSEQLATEAPASEIDEAQVVVEDFMAAFAEFEFKDAAEFLEDGDSIELPFDNMDTLYDLIKDQATESMGATGMEEDIIDKLLVPVFDEYISYIHYSIESAEEKGNKYVFTVDLEYLDPDTLSGIDVSEKSEQFSQELIMEALESGTISEDMTEEELMEALLTPLLEGAANICIEEMQNCDTISETIELTVIENGGEYFIQNTDDLETLFDMNALKDFSF